LVACLLLAGCQQSPQEKKKAEAMAVLRAHVAFDLTRLTEEKVEVLVDEQEAAILSVAASQMSREAFTDWLVQHVVPKT